MSEEEIVERLRDKAFRACGPTMNAIHTKLVEWKAADTIEALRAENARLRDLLDSALGWLDDKEHDKPLLSVDSIRAARAAMERRNDLCA